MRYLFVFCIACVSQQTLAQTDQQQIDEQVWKPFTKAIMTQDVNGFVAVHSMDLVRAERDQKLVMDLKTYRERMEASWPSWKESMQKNKTAYTFELRFLERISNGTMAYEVGYYKNEMTLANGQKRIDYGKFQVALRKENGVWKILVDSDTSEQRSITEEMFKAAESIK